MHCSSTLDTIIMHQSYGIPFQLGTTLCGYIITSYIITASGAQTKTLTFITRCQCTAKLCHQQVGDYHYGCIPYCPIQFQEWYMVRACLCIYYKVQCSDICSTKDSAYQDSIIAGLIFALLCLGFMFSIIWASAQRYLIW